MPSPEQSSPPTSTSLTSHLYVSDLPCNHFPSLTPHLPAGFASDVLGTLPWGALQSLFSSHRARSLASFKFFFRHHLVSEVFSAHQNKCTHPSPAIVFFHDNYHDKCLHTFMCLLCVSLPMRRWHLKAGPSSVLFVD